MTLGQEYTVTGTGGIELSYDGSLNDLISGSQSITAQFTGDLDNIMFDTVLGIMTASLNLLGSTVISTIKTTLTTTVATAAAALLSAATGLVSTALAPVFPVLGGLAEMTINIQGLTDNVFTEIPINISLLSDIVTLDLGKVTVGPNVFTIQ